MLENVKSGSKFTAHDLEGESTHEIEAPPNRITNHELRKTEWQQAAANATAPQQPSRVDRVRKTGRVQKGRVQKGRSVKTATDVEQVISYDGADDQGPCLVCDAWGDDEKCTEYCYLDFKRKNFVSTETIQIRGPHAVLGYRAYTTEDIAKNDWIAEYLGELRPLSVPATVLSRYRIEIPGRCAIDAGERGNWTRYMNSSCNPNVRLVGEYIGKREVVFFQALRDIRGGEELTFNYGRAYFEKAGIQCQCDAREGQHIPGLKERVIKRAVQKATKKRAAKKPR